METRASISKHPLHPMLVMFPIALWVFSLVCDGMLVWTADQMWGVIAFYTMVGGLVGAILAGMAGLADLMGLKDAHIKHIALLHMGINVAVVVAYAINIGLRLMDVANPPGFAMLLSLISVAAIGVSGWLGGEMVHVHGVGVAGHEPAAWSGVERRVTQRPADPRLGGGAASWADRRDAAGVQGGADRRLRYPDVRGVSSGTAHYRRAA